MHKATREEQAKHQAKVGETRTTVATIRWAQVLPVDFDGEDTSLTQAQLAVLK
jgi:diacylglycerol kinase family enzyme